MIKGFSLFICIGGTSFIFRKGIVPLIISELPACVSPPLYQKKAAEKVATAPSPLKWPFCIKNNPDLDSPSKVHIYEYGKDDYMMISQGGVLSKYGEDCEFISAEHWDKDYDFYCKCMRIPFFARYKMWKPFYVWRKSIIIKKIQEVKEKLQLHLFIISEVCDCVHKLNSRFSLNLF